jgi:hypothetical protein
MQCVVAVHGFRSSGPESGVRSLHTSKTLSFKAATTRWPSGLRNAMLTAWFEARSTSHGATLSGPWLLQLLGSTPVRRVALGDLAALLADAWERQVALPVEERDFLMETWEWFEQ